MPKIEQALESEDHMDDGSSAGGGIFLLGMIVFWIAIVLFMLYVWGTIFKKAGYSFWLCLLMVIPLANLIWLLVFAFSTWPIHREMEALRRGGTYPAGFPVTPTPQ